ncbi:ATP-dependent helicase [Candidatus Saccharibacteria bacterium]|nr:ATP-dependent helicase [Candidatus Saccharibacteria bacterium]MBR3121981.1 ATP-dependent helicase [Candidatus Saccharibacteria bacterium]
MRLNERQKQAVEYLDGPLLVLAGPGTGKTQLLSEKVAYILQNTDTNPDNILCLTFTETGASNMRERLKSIIKQDAMKVNINTYHAFGTDILLQYKNYAEDYDRNLNTAIDEVTQFKVVKEIQDHLNGCDIMRGDAVKDIVSVISAAKSAGLSADDLSKIAQQNIADSQVLSNVISPLLSKVVPRVFKQSFDEAYAPIYELLKDYTETKPILKKVERNINILARDLKDALIQAESSQKIKPLSEWKDKYFEKGPRGNYLLKDRVANAKLLSIANIMKKYDEVLRDNGWFDFDDMIQEALKVLKSDKGFKATLSERYQFIMLDEFQDTNPSQFAIIKELTDYEKPLIMAVGDDDQAIYEFQGALSTNLTDFQKYYEANVIPLVDNYRSTQEILDLSRKIINEAPDRFADKELIAHQKSPASSQIFRHEFLSSDMEYGFVAKEIAKLIKKGVPQDQIAVISYKTKYFMPLLPYLKAYPEIKIAYDKKDNLLEDEKIHEILTIARFIYEVANEKPVSVPIMEVLAYPFFNLPILEVIKLVHKARDEKRAVFDVLSETDNPKLKEIAEFLANLVGKSFNEPLEIFLDYLIGALELNGFRSPFLSYYTKDDFAAFSLYENIAALRGILKRHFGDKSLKLADLISLLDDYEAADMPLNTDSPYRDADKAVSLLSAHKAKGLEFEYVFIITADHMAWGKGKGNNNLLVLPKNLTFIRHTGTTDGEKLRILYVALTRAKSTIYITNALKDFNGKSPERLEYLEEYVDGNEVISPLIGKVNLHYEIDAYPTAENNLKNWLEPYVKATPDMQSLYLDRASKWRMSASALTDFIDVAYAGPQNFFERFILKAPQPPENESLAYGDLLHKVFEKATKDNLDSNAALKYFLDELDKKELPTEVLNDIREKRPQDLLVALNGFKNVIYNGKAEVDLAPEKISIDGVPVTGKIDHITIDEVNKTIEVYDYKTGHYHKENWRSHMTLYRYMMQLGFYKLLLNNSPTYSKYKIKRAHILFVTPDNDGEVYDKVYEYNVEDEKELLSLITAVYKLVSTLDFMKDPEIFVSPNQDLGIKGIKEFVKLLLAKNN